MSGSLGAHVASVTKSASLTSPPEIGDEEREGNFNWATWLIGDIEGAKPNDPFDKSAQNVGPLQNGL